MAKPVGWYLAELKRRRVYRVAIVYAVVAFAIWQVADILFPGLGLPDTAVSLVLILTILGFPIALVLAWAYEVTPEASTEPTPARQTHSERATREDASPVSDKGSIAVLPFENLSAEPDSEFFADGVTEEITHTLAQFAGIRVVARTSAFAFKGRAADVRDVARQLNVSHVLEGSVRRVGQRLRITAQLIDAHDGYHLWSERFDRDLDDVFTIQEEIAGQIAEQLSSRLPADAGRPAAASRRELQPAPNLTAYDAYLRGRQRQAVFDPGSLITAIDCFQEAIRADPQFAHAHAALAESYSAQAIGLGLASRDTMPKAKAAADRALELAPELADGHVARALVALFYDREYDSAKRGLDRALELNPNSADAYLWSEFYWTYIARDYEAALAATKRAQELSPLDPSIRSRLGTVHYLFGQLDKALVYYRALTRAEPDYPIFHMGLGDVLMRLGDVEEGAAEANRALEMIGLDQAAGGPLGVAGSARGLMGDEEGARAMLSVLELRAEAGYVTAFWQATVYGGLGQMDDAFVYLEQALEQRDCNLIYICAAPRQLGFRDDPRLPSVLERLNLSHLTER